MPSRTRRISIRCTPEEHELWTGAAFEEEVSLEEFVRRGASARAMEGAPATDGSGRSARTIRGLIAHYEAMLALIEKGPELGIVASLVICHCCLHGHDRMPHLPFL